VILKILLAGALSAISLLAAKSKVTAANAQLKEGKFEQAIAALEAEHKANPKDAEVKTALAGAHLAYGESLMNNPQMPPFRKYPGALRQFRQVLTYDANNKKAKDNIALIEGIYKSMGREVPQ
jgi:tetratricopeptide (TPR) repeat protein